MAKARRQWANPAGKTISWVALAVAFASGLGALAAGLGWMGSAEEGPALRWAVASAFAALALVAMTVSLYPTWSVTVGRRGIGVRKLGRTRFVDYEGLVEVSVEPRRIRLQARSGGVTIYPRLEDTNGLVDHIRTLQRDAERNRDET